MKKLGSYELGVILEAGLVVFYSSLIVVGHHECLAHFAHQIGVIRATISLK